MRASKFAPVLAGIALAVTHFAVASPGGTDGNGCHASAKLGYHCHAKRAGAAERQADQRRGAEDRRLTRECKGRPNAGACAGYAR